MVSRTLKCRPKLLHQAVNFSFCVKWEILVWDLMEFDWRQPQVAIKRNCSLWHLSFDLIFEPLKLLLGIFPSINSIG